MKIAVAAAQQAALMCAQTSGWRSTAERSARLARSPSAQPVRGGVEEAPADEVAEVELDEQDDGAARRR